MGMAIGGANVNTNKTNTTTEADKPIDKAVEKSIEELNAKVQAMAEKMATKEELHKEKANHLMRVVAVAGLILAAIWGVNSDIKSTVRDGDTLNKERYVLLDKKMDLMTSEIKANIKDELKPIQEAIKANSPQAK